MGTTKRKAAALRLRIGRERKAARYRPRFSPKLRSDVVAFARESGLSCAALARTLGLGETVLYRWLRAPGRAADAKRPRLKAVEVVEGTENSSAELTLEFRNGARVRGLSLAQLRKLLGDES